MAQARHVAALLETADGDLDVTLVPVESSGDADRITPVAALTEIGAFVRSLQLAVLDGRADAAVHSCKDLPVTGPDGVVAAAYPSREDAFDCLVGCTLDDLPLGGLVGTGSPRRSAQLAALRPDVRTVELRGNVETRIDKVARGDVSAAILAVAGLTRIERDDDITQRFTLEQMVPAPAQGTLVVETLASGPARERIAQIDDEMVRRTAEVERSLLAATGAGCRSALGAYAEENTEGFAFSVFVSDEAGARRTMAHGEDASDLIETVRRELRF